MTFVLEVGKVSVQRAGSVVARTAGACRSDHAALTPDELRQSAEYAIADETSERRVGYPGITKLDVR